MVTYDQVNQAWPSDLPAISQKEAQVFAIRLNKAFQRKTGRVISLPSSWLLSRSWASTSKTRNRKGWRRIVHDVSHHVHYVIHNGKLKSHSPVHAELELRMIEYVIRKGWIEKAVPVVVSRTDKMIETKNRLEARLAG